MDLESFNAEDEKKNSGIKMDLLMNLELNVSIELGRTEMQIKDIVSLMDLDFDMDYTKEWCARLGLDFILGRVLDERHR